MAWTPPPTHNQNPIQVLSIKSIQVHSSQSQIISRQTTQPFNMASSHNTLLRPRFSFSSPHQPLGSVHSHSDSSAVWRPAPDTAFRVPLAPRCLHPYQVPASSEPQFLHAVSVVSDVLAVLAAAAAAAVAGQPAMPGFSVLPAFAWQCLPGRARQCCGLL